MPSILVLEDDPRSLERIHQTLGVAGWRVRAVHEPAQAFHAATSERPDLVIVGAAVAGAAAVAGSFSRRTGGPGVLGLVPSGADPAGFADLTADVLLPQPFSDQELLAAVQRAGTAPRAATVAPTRPAADSKLTSHDIFGDVLAEMEMADEPAAAARPRAPAPPRSAPARPSSDDEINRKLEQTLSGVLGSDLGRSRAVPPAAPPLAAAVPPRAATPAPPSRRPAESAGDDDIDAILSRTLGNLEIGTRSRPAPPRPVPPPVPVPAPPAEGTAVRKAPRTTDGGLSELAELTRTFRTTPASAAPAAPAPPAAPPAPAAPFLAPTPAVPPLPETPAEEPFPIEAVETPPPPVFVQPVSAPPPASTAPLFAPPPAAAPPPLPELLSGSIFGVDPFDLTALEVPPPVEMDEPEPVVVEAEPAAPFDLMDLEIEPEPPAAVAPPPPAIEKPAPVSTGDFAVTQRIPVMLDDTSLNAGAERFGQYTLLERIAAGGMAEVWKARMRGVEGFQKTVAIKKILSHMTDNSEFIGMFIDEAKLAAQLSHPNIVHIYDLGKIGRDYYIAMEYVEGKDLRSLLNAARRKGEPLSLGLALLISARLASALDYAHRKRDFEGKELSLVHRDVSPQNVLLTREGDVKLCDFGIAKAVSKAGQTQIGSLKGKLQYMSPEQAWGRPVDARSDIFSLGAVLFEMLTGERLFAGDNEMSILEAVRNGHIRTPRDIDPTIPAEVDEIVVRALAYDVRDRFQSAGEMMQRIESVLHTLVPSPGPGELAVYLERVAAPEPSGDILFLPPPAPVAATPARLPDAEVPPSLFAPAPAPAEALPVEAVAPVGAVHVEETGGRRSRLVLVIAIIVVLLVGVIATFFFLRGRRGPTPPPAATEPEAPAPAAAASSQPVAPAPVPAPVPQANPTATPADVEAILKEELAKREQELRRKYEARTRQLEREVEKAQKDAQSREKGATGEPAPSAAPPPRPQQN